MEEISCIEYRLFVALWRLELAVLQKPFDFFGEGMQCGTSEQRSALEQQFLRHYASCGNCRQLSKGQPALPGLETICQLAL